MNIAEEDINQFVGLAAETVMRNDREMYDPYFVAFEEYAIANHLTYTLASAARAIIATSSRPAYDSYFITTSSSRPEDDARAVANIIMGIKPIADMPKRVTLSKDAAGWVVIINGRGCFKITADMKYRGKSVDSIVGYQKGIGLWTGNEVRCQNIYGVCGYLLSQSYDPLRILPEDVSKGLLRDLLPMIIPNTRSGGGGRNRHQKEQPKKMISSDKLYLISTRRGLPLYLYDGPFDEVRKTLPTSSRVAAYSLHDYDDFALTKYIIHDSDDRAVSVFYDSLERQMVPITSNRRVAKAYTMRILILEIQMLLLMSHLGKDMTGMIKDITNDIVTLMHDDTSTDVIGYAGAAVNWMILRREQGGFFGVFYPNDQGNFDRQPKKGGYDGAEEAKSFNEMLEDTLTPYYPCL